MLQPPYSAGTAPSSKASPGIRRTPGHLERHFTDAVHLEELAALAVLGVCRVVTVFRRQVGLAPHRFMRHRRIAHAEDLLRERAQGPRQRLPAWSGDPPALAV